MRVSWSVQERFIQPLYVYMYVPTLPHGQHVTQGQFFKWSLTGLDSEFSFS